MEFRLSTDIAGFVHKFVHNDDGLCKPSHCVSHNCKSRVIKTLTETPELNEVVFERRGTTYNISKISREKYMSKISTLIDIIPDVDGVANDINQLFYTMSVPATHIEPAYDKEYLFIVILCTLKKLKSILEITRRIIMHASDNGIPCPLILAPPNEELTVILQTAVAQNYFHDLKTETGDEITYHYIETLLYRYSKAVSKTGRLTKPALRE